MTLTTRIFTTLEHFYEKPYDNLLLQYVGHSNPKTSINYELFRHNGQKMKGKKDGENNQFQLPFLIFKGSIRFHIMGIYCLFTIVPFFTIAVAKKNVMYPHKK